MTMVASDLLCLLPVSAYPGTALGPVKTPTLTRRWRG